MSVVWTNGCFDVLHRGHIEMLKYAKSLGHVLYVGIDSDQKVRQDKGKSRPFNSQDDRAYLLQAIRFVDEVIIFDSKDDLANNIRKVSPDFLVVGSDWKGKDVVGDEYAGEVKYFTRIGDYSTSRVLGEK